MNWSVLIPVVAVVVAIVAFLVYRNLRDEKKLEQEMDEPKKAKPHEGEQKVWSIGLLQGSFIDGTKQKSYRAHLRRCN